MTTETFVLSEEMVAGPARLRIDVLGGEPRDHVLDDMSFMDYRLADVRIAPEATLPEPDVAKFSVRRLPENLTGFVRSSPPESGARAATKPSTRSV